MDNQRYRTSTLVVFALALITLAVSILSASIAIWYPHAIFVSLGGAVVGLFLLGVTLEMAEMDDPIT